MTSGSGFIIFLWTRASTSSPPEWVISILNFRPALWSCYVLSFLSWPIPSQPSGGAPVRPSMDGSNMATHIYASPIAGTRMVSEKAFNSSTKGSSLPRPADGIDSGTTVVGNFVSSLIFVAVLLLRSIVGLGSRHYRLQMRRGCPASVLLLPERLLPCL